MTTFHIISLFPDSLESYLNTSIIKRAQKDGYISLKYYNPRDYALAKKKKIMTYAERRVDDRPYGGGPGMVLEALPIMRAIESAIKNSENAVKGKSGTRTALRMRSKLKVQDGAKTQKSKTKIVFFSPSGKQFTNQVADTFKKYTDIILVCGRYEGIDARVKKAFPMIDISVGPYVLTGGELPAMIVIDAVTRRIEGVLGDNHSIEELRISSPLTYTRPEVIEFKGKKYRVPKILLSGHHAKMNEWRKARRR